jgi:hypothetical protein
MVRARGSVCRAGNIDISAVVLSRGDRAVIFIVFAVVSSGVKEDGRSKEARICVLGEKFDGWGRKVLLW